MKLLVAGSRTCPYEGLVNSQILLMRQQYPAISEIVEGGATGVDRFARVYALHNDLDIRTFQADWDRYGKSAGPIRNVEMANYADLMLLVWDGKSRGSRHMLNTFQELNKPYRVCLFGAVEHSPSPIDGGKVSHQD